MQVEVVEKNIGQRAPYIDLLQDLLIPRSLFAFIQHAAFLLPNRSSSRLDHQPGGFQVRIIINDGYFGFNKPSILTLFVTDRPWGESAAEPGAREAGTDLLSGDESVALDEAPTVGGGDTD